MPATIPIIAIKPLKRSAPEFMTIKLKIEYNHRKKVGESGIPNGLTYEKNSKKGKWKFNLTKDERPSLK